LARKSYDLAYFMREVDVMLSENLKMKTVIYMMDNQDEITNDPDVLNTSNTEGPEYFHLYVKISDEIILHRIFDAKLYPPKVRYTVDVRPSLKIILKGLTDIFSAQNLYHDYLSYDLSR